MQSLYFAGVVGESEPSEGRKARATRAVNDVLAHRLDQPKREQCLSDVVGLFGRESMRG